MVRPHLGPQLAPIARPLPPQRRNLPTKRPHDTPVWLRSCRRNRRRGGERRRIARAPTGTTDAGRRAGRAVWGYTRVWKWYTPRGPVDSAAGGVETPLGAGAANRGSRFGAPDAYLGGVGPGPGHGKPPRAAPVALLLPDAVGRPGRRGVLVPDTDVHQDPPWPPRSAPRRPLGHCQGLLGGPMSASSPCSAIPTIRSEFIDSSVAIWGGRNTQGPGALACRLPCLLPVWLP